MQTIKKETSIQNSTFDLEISIHLCDGNVRKFVQQDPKLVAEMLDNLRADKVFSGGNLLIGSSHSITVISPAHVARIDLVRASQPSWFPEQQQMGAHVYELSEQQLIERHREGTLSRSRGTGAAGVLQSEVAEIILCSGQKYFLEIHSIARSTAEQRTILHNVLNRTPFFFRRFGGGASLLNEANIQSITFYPGLLALPATAWLGEPLAA